MADSSLSGLPVDLLRPITSLLTGVSIALLWLTGDRRLQHVMSLGGVSQFELKTALAFPRLVGQFELSTLDIELPFHKACPYVFTSGVDLTALPRTLRRLGLNFPNALCRLCSLPSGLTLASLVPNLEILVFSEQYVPVMGRRAFINSLPSRLTKLILPPSISFPIEALECLPCGLTDLGVVIAPTHGQEDRLRNAISLQQVTTFHLSTFLSERWPLMIPSGVTDLSIRTLSTLYSHFDRNFIESNTLYIDTTNENYDDIGALPQTLTSLKMAHHMMLTPAIISRLPPDLTSLTFGLCVYDFDELVSALPRKLTYLSTNFVAPNYSQSQRLPPTIAQWKGLHIALDGPALPQDATPFTLSHLCIDNVCDAHLRLIPSTLVALDASFESIKKQSLEVLIKSLKVVKRLCLSFRCPVDLHALHPLPRLLESFVLRCPEPARDTMLLDWSRFWPPLLRGLSLSFGRPRLDDSGYLLTDPVDPYRFWNSLPQTLDHLFIYIKPVNIFPENLSGLPRSLTGLSLSCETSKTAPAISFTNEHFATLPRSITDLALTGFSFKTDETTLSLLPKTLLEFSEGYTNPSKFLGLDISLPAGTSLNWKHLDQAPRFFAVRSRTRKQQFAVRMALRQYDDLVQECRNAAFDELPAGASRPYNTPKHGTDSVIDTEDQYS